MKISKLKTVLLMFGLAPLMVTNSKAQASELTINQRNKPLREVIRVIEKSSDYVFFYNNRDIDLNRRVTVQTKGEPINKALDQMFSGSKNGYRIDGRQIYVTVKAEAKPTEVTMEAAPEPQQPPGISITGKVTDDNGAPLPGVNVVVKGSTTGTVTNAEGKYTIAVPNEQAVLQFSFVGYALQDVVVGDRRTIDVTMSESTQNIEEVVVVGYGTQKKVNLTGAVEAVGEEVFEGRTLANTTQALQGAIPNLNISLADGKPGRTASFNVRGTTSIGQGGSALVLIDGVEGDPAYLNPNDIESVSVLKDAASAAIYGARGSFGVVLITTKRPQKGRTTVNYTGNFSMQQPTMLPDFVTDAVTWVEHYRAAWVGERVNPPTTINNDSQLYSDEWLDRLRTWKASGEGPKQVTLPNGRYEYYANTDWYDMLYKDHTLTQDHNLTISGGSDKADFYLSGRFYDFGGLYNYNPDTWRSYNIRAKGSLQAYKWLRLADNFEVTNTDYHQPYTTQGWSITVQRYMQVNAPPSSTLYNDNGTYTRNGAGTLGAFIDGNNYQNNNNKLYKNTVSFATNFFDNALRINGDFTMRYNTRNYFRKRTKTNYEQAENVTAYMGDANGIIYEWTGHTLYTASNLYAEFEKTFNEAHYFKGMLGWGYETSSYRADSEQRNELFVESAESIALAGGSAITLGSSATDWRLAGSYFRFNYGYKNRYLLEVNGRYDGSSRFPSDQQWGFFPSVSAGWRITEEPFWHVDKDIVSDIKVRASYGSLGNGNIAPYSYLEVLSITNSGKVLGGKLNRKTNAPAPIPVGLTWETATTTDIGLDFGLDKGRFRFSGDYYIRKTTDMYTVGPTLPEVFGADSPKGNYADMTTRGWEISLSYQNQFTLGSKPFKWNVRATLYDYVSEIDNFNNATMRFTTHYKGKTIGELWGFQTEGFFKTDPTADEYVNTIFKSSNDSKWRAGDLKIKNIDGSHNDKGAETITKGDQTLENPGDMTIIGNTEPRYQYSFSLGAEWNGIFFSAFFYGVGKQEWYPGQEAVFWGQYNRGYNYLPSWHLGNYWTPENPDAYLPRYAQYNGACGYSNHVPNDRYLQKVSYLRLKNLQIGYNLPTAWIKALRMSSARIYLSGENIASWSPLYKRTRDFDVLTATGIRDPDLNSDQDQGAGNGYPLLKTYTLGVSVTF